MENHPDYYELLELENKRYDTILTPREVKAAYRRALLQYHPDKKPNGLAGGSRKTKSPVTVDDIALAYKTLLEPELRAEYDRWLQSRSKETSTGSLSRPHRTGLETVDLDDLDYTSESGLWTRGCRCGEATGFVVSEAELERNAEDGELIVGCKGCSLWLRVLFAMEE